MQVFSLILWRIELSEFLILPVLLTSVGNIYLIMTYYLLNQILNSNLLIYYFCLGIFFSFSFFYIYYFWQTERDRAQVGEGQRETKTQNPKQAPGSELSAQGAGLELTNPEIMTWAEVGRSTNWATQVPWKFSIFLWRL